MPSNPQIICHILSLQVFVVFFHSFIHFHSFIFHSFIFHSFIFHSFIYSFSIHSFFIYFSFIHSLFIFHSFFIYLFFHIKHRISHQITLAFTKRYLHSLSFPSLSARTYLTLLLVSLLIILLSANRFPSPLSFTPPPTTTTHSPLLPYLIKTVHLISAFRLPNQPMTLDHHLRVQNRMTLIGTQRRLDHR
jgi:hypothetical protein